MTEAEILDELEVIASRVVTRPRVAPLRPELHLVDDLELDSLERLSLVVEVEDRFRLCLDEGDEGTLATVADLVRLIAERRT